MISPATRSFAVTALGELVIDLIPTPSPAGLAYLAKPGGAPANVAAGVARLGHASAMISKVGDEPFGAAALAALGAAGVDTDGVSLTSRYNTALAVTSLTPDGQAAYIFYRENCADSQLSPDDVPLDLIEDSRFLHVGTLLLATPRSAAAQIEAIAHAKTCRTLIATDLNFRIAFWRDPTAMKGAGLDMFRAANVVKIGADELAVLAGPGDVIRAVRSLWHTGLRVVAVTQGAAGADLLTADMHCHVPAFPVDVVDTIGCGDAFMAVLLAGLADLEGTPPGPGDLTRIGRRACAAGALIATAAGALENMPTDAAIEAFLASRASS